MSKKGIQVIIGVAIILIVALIGYIVLIKEINELIREDKTFTYQTSLTDNYGTKSKADIYMSSLGFESTVTYIKELKKPDYTQKNSEEMYAQLAYENHEVLVYKAEDSEGVLVQVAALTYLRTNGYGHMYRGPRLGGVISINDYHYGRGYSYRRPTSTSSSRPTPSSSSVRQGSSGSRSAIGGGTGFGK